ncbi:ATP-binding protein [bacterium]|nr:ATP-binding protein [bacterium]
MKAHDSDAIIYSRYFEDHVLIKLRDSVNPNSVLDRLHTFFDNLSKEGIEHIVFDMGNVPFPSGSFIALLIAKTIEIRHRGGDLQIINLLDTARNNFSFFTPLTFLSIVTDADHFEPSAPGVPQKSKTAEVPFDEADSMPRRIRVNATVDAVQDITDFVNAWAEREHIEPITLSKFRIAVHEACMNVIEHGYQFAEGKELEIEVNTDDRCFMTIISDWGIPFEDFGKRDYNVQEAFEKQQRGGYGFYIMQQSVDEIRYEFGEGGNRLTLVLEYPVPEEGNNKDD